MDKIPSQQDIFPKRSHGRKPTIDPLFPLPPNHILWIRLTVGPPPLYWLDTGWWCLGPSVLALLSFVITFHVVSVVANYLCFGLLHVLSYFFMRFLLHLSFSFGLAFLSFTWFLLLTLSAVPCFFSSCFFILVFTLFLLHKRIWAFVGQIMLTGSKGSWAQFVFVCQSHSARELYYAADLYSAADLCFAVDCFHLHLFLWTFLAL